MRAWFSSLVRSLAAGAAGCSTRPAGAIRCGLYVLLLCLELEGRGDWCGDEEREWSWSWSFAGPPCPLTKAGMVDVVVGGKRCVGGVAFGFLVI